MTRTSFSQLAIGDRFYFRTIFIGRKFVKTGHYSFTCLLEFDDIRQKIRREEILTDDFPVIKTYGRVESETVDKRELVKTAS